MKRLASIAAALALAGCQSGPSFGPARSAVLSEAQGAESKGQDDTGALPYMRGGAAVRALDTTGAGKISHVVFIVQENRSFDNLFQGYPGADTVASGKDSKGETLQLKPKGLGYKVSIDHSAEAMFESCDGTGKLPGTDCKMDGFDLEQSFPSPFNHPQYDYVPQTDSKPYFDMAHEWVLADKTFASELDESFVAHQYLIAGQAAWSVNLPTNQWWGCGGGRFNWIETITKDRNTSGGKIKPCYEYQTLGDELDKAKLSWRFYAAAFGKDSNTAGGTWSAYRAVKHIYDGPDWKNDVISPNWKFITDVRAGTLANVTWITPVCPDSDHTNCGGGRGPSWVAALVNTIGKSKFWKSTAIFVIWDDWGGLYDHVPPPYADRDGLGFRVPLLVISPYAKHGHVSHVPYETASLPRFAEDLFGLSPLAAADKRANSPAKDCFDFSQQPRPFVKIAAPLAPRFFMHKHNDDYFIPDYE
ncbi:MAG: alkaline phosphatase family protein [Candidatus Cybelea sp.]